MYEFMFGLFFGAIAMTFRKVKQKDAQVQADELVIRPSDPVPIPFQRKKTFVPGELESFWE